MMIRFTKFRVFVALLLTATFVGSYMFAGSYRTTKACELNNCSDGCHLYHRYGSIGSSGAKLCSYYPNGTYWNVGKVHVGATIPGGFLHLGGPMTRWEVWEDCCFRCLGNTPATTTQETMDHVKFFCFINVDKHSCESTPAE